MTTTHAPRFFMAAPSNEPHTRYLHRTGCKHTRVRNRGTLATESALRMLLHDVEKQGSYWLNFRVTCPCVKHEDPVHLLHEARADAWLNILAEDSAALPRMFAERARLARREALRAEWLAQFDTLRVGAEALWGAGTDWRTGYEFALLLHDEHGWRQVTIPLTVTDGATGVTVDPDGLNTGSWISQPDRIHRLSRVLHFIEMWRAPAPLSVPAEAPSFYRAA